MDSATGYCVKCRGRREIDVPQRVEMRAKGGRTRPALRGTCVECRTGLIRILPEKGRE